MEIAIDDCMTLAYNREHFMQLMEWRGYEVTWSDTRKNITYTTPQGYKCRDRKLNGRKYLKEEMENGLFEITDVQLKACKEWMKHNRVVRSSKPDYWVNAILLRYLEGKDFTTGYAGRIDKVTSEGVRKLMSSLKDAGKVEYIIRRK